MQKSFVNRNELKNIVDKAVRVLDRNNTIPVLGTIKIDIEHGVLTVTATNLDQTFESSVGISGNQMFSGCVEGKLFSQLINKLSDESIGLSVDNNKLTVHFTGGKTGFGVVAAEQFPELEELKERDLSDYCFKFNTNEFTEAIAFSALTLDDAEGIPNQFRVAKLQIATNLIESSFHLISSDRNVLSLIDGLCEKKEGVEDKTIFFSRQSFSALLQILPGFGGEFFLKETDKHIIIFTNLYTYAFRKTSVSFPDVSAVTSREYPITFNLSLPELRESLSRAALLADKHNHSVVFDFSDGELEISALNDGCDLEETLCGKLAGEEGFKVGFNLNYLNRIFNKTKDAGLISFYKEKQRDSERFNYPMKVSTVAANLPVKADFFIQSRTV